ncbi:hypothetical protein F9V24_27015, partial [Escherichia coli]|nr:hypothetical protein [Escherichia coli]
HILLIGCITLADLSYCPSIVIIIFLTPLISFNMLCRKQYYIMVEFPDFLGPVMGYPASLHSNRHFRLLRRQLSSWLRESLIFPAGLP